MIKLINHGKKIEDFQDFLKINKKIDFYIYITVSNVL